MVDGSEDAARNEARVAISLRGGILFRNHGAREEVG
jgi:hypothetical protein